MKWLDRLLAAFERMAEGVHQLARIAFSRHEAELTERHRLAELAKVPAPDPPSPRPRIRFECCNRSDFAVGTPTASPWYDGETVGVEHAGPMLCCAHCGKKYGLAPGGPYEPHPDALPPQWAQSEMMRRQIEAEVKRRADKEDPRILSQRPRGPKPMARPVEDD